MIVDVHSHVFPPAMIERRDRLVRSDPAFGELYGDPAARMASAEDLIASMDAAGVDRSVVAGFWWREGALAEEHASYLLEAAAGDGRLIPFVPADLGAPDARERLAALAERGARGLGEVRPDNQPSGEEGTDATALLAYATGELGLALLVHCSEQPGHQYSGKDGGYTPGALWELIEACSAPNARVIAAHWGGGFPFYALMPEVRTALAQGRVAFDSAASPLLYEPDVFERVANLVGGDLTLWGSDFPLRKQASDRAAVEAAVGDAAHRAAVLGGNSARFLGL
ncbi:MAG TPA: amidohydrolase family protein [Dehalococcoidia bacterium]|nr:amidohydrolase family protein [Dehalococcoidia bacterium]